ncbi:hypothetical protein FKM82_024272 [Ascaphus truei]
MFWTMGERVSIPNETLRDLIGSWRFPVCGDTGVKREWNCHNTYKVRPYADVASQQTTACCPPTALVQECPRKKVTEPRRWEQDFLEPVDGNENVRISAPVGADPHG